MFFIWGGAVFKICGKIPMMREEQLPFVGEILGCVTKLKSNILKYLKWLK
jgi:hypothetical protein